MNNGAGPLSGPLWCTGDMIRALPDFDCHVIILTGKVDEDSYRVLGKRPGDGHVHPHPETHRLLNELKPDVVVYQNTRVVNMPLNKLDCIEVYYAHSDTLHHSQMARCDLSLSVSHYLSRLDIDGQPQDVLYQPVGLSFTEFPNPNRRTFDACRLASPHPVKWQLLENERQLLKVFLEFLKRHSGKYHLSYHSSDFRMLESELFLGSPRVVKEEDPSIGCRRLLSSCGLMVYLNTTFPESFGRTIREAQRCGCVPIVANSGAFPELLSDTPELVVSNRAELLFALDAYLSNPEEMRAKVKAQGDRDGSLQAWRSGFLERLSSVSLRRCR